MIEFIFNYWLHIAVVALFATGAFLFVRNEIANIKEWLLYAVTEAEKALGSNTGRLKLRQVYDDFLKTFPIMSKFIPFSVFSRLVDLALIEMRKLLSTNLHCKAYVKEEK